MRGRLRSSPLRPGQSFGAVAPLGAPLQGALLQGALVLCVGVVAAIGVGAVPAAAAAPPTSAGPTDGTVLVRGSDGSVPLALTGTAEPGDVIDASLTWPDGELELCAVFTGPDGTWACDDLPALPDLVGTLDLSADGGVFSSVTIGVISSPSLLADADDPSRLTIDPLAPWVSGSGTPGATVVVDVSDGDGCVTAVDASGAWGCDLATGAAPAGRTVRAGQSWALDPATIAWGTPVSLVSGVSTVVGAPGDPETPGPAGTGGDPGVGSATAGDAGAVGGLGGVVDGGESGAANAGSPAAGPGAEGGESAPSSGVSDSGDAVRLTPGPAAEVPPPAWATGGAATAAGAGAGASGAGASASTPSSVANPVQSPFSAESGGAPTFGASLHGPAAFVEAGGPAFVFTGAAALGLVLLVMVPAGMLESTLEANSERLRRSAALRWLKRLPRVPRLPSRGRAGTVISVALVVTATAALGAFVAPDAGSEGGFLRLAGAFVLASLGVNGLALGLMAAAARVSGSRLEVTANGRSVFVTALTVLLSRAALLQPGFVFGVAIGAEATDRRPRTSRLVAAAGVVGLLVAGVGAWFAHSALLAAVGEGGSAGPAGSTAGGWGSFGVDVLTAMTIEALTGAVVAMIPLRFFAGAELWRGARTTWAALAALTAAAAMAALAPLPSAWNAVGGDTARWLLAFAAVTALTAAVWCWFRFVPERTTASAGRHRTPRHRPAH
ncbi:hypothetical protein NY547_01865 [Cnuibacter physcomitrellae]|uniref:hypothetical protein n=1 Tax=Cnuibacter physcomitrellae TaxID=1619308 RepID=UPI002175727F|nr:hypothetical protein [Cnuibacter physcomitrellae]MCS5495985.1 hypothetical protein [Cnuibacter physcomitrellae]